MEQKARKGRSAVFSVAFEFTAQGEWFDVSEIEVKPYDTNSKLYQTYTAERKPHIHFSKKIRELTDRITQNAQTPIDHLQAIYRYIAANYPWASALEYSTIANIPEYVIEHHKGDCGQVALLLITMLRYKGIPARWQSGWMTHPGEVNLHDWAEVYLEGTGWVPVDISFGRGGAIPIKPGREFFMSGIDSYRLYVNSDFSGDFFPGKKFPRSETVDFQRGEVETDLRNLYFDEWSYHMKVKYIE
jgi:transglutaminase-like putative cysteine protease